MEKSEASLPYANCPNTCSRQRLEYPNSICRGETNDAIQIVIHGVFRIWSDSTQYAGPVRGETNSVLFNIIAPGPDIGAWGAYCQALRG